MSSNRPAAAGPARRFVPLAAGALLSALALGLLPGALAAPGDSAADAIPVGPDGRFWATTGPGRSTWFFFRYPGGNQTLSISLEYQPADSSSTSMTLYTGNPQSPGRAPRDVTRTDNVLSATFDHPNPENVFIQFSNNHSDRTVSVVGMVTPGTIVATPAPGTATATPGPIADNAQSALAVASDGSAVGTLGPQRAVWYKFWYGNPGVEAVVSVTFSATADNTDLNLYTGPDPANLTQQGGAPARSGDTLTRRINLPNPQFLYFSIANNSTSLTVAYGGKVTPTFATPTPLVTPTPTATATPTSAPTSTPVVVPPSTPAPRDARYFPETGFRIDRDAIWSYFNLRGGIDIFGPPVSRTFRFLGFDTQFFQRKLVQIGPDGNARFMNLLDPGLMGFATSINFSPIPPHDEGLAQSAPRPGSPGYDTAIVEFIRQNAPDIFDDRPVNFYRTFIRSVTCEIAFPGQFCMENLLPLMDLEIWGSITSRPLVDPNNRRFIFVRWQRGVMHFDETNNVTVSVLLADWFKSLMTGNNLPADLEEQARRANSRFLRQYCPGNPNWLCRPAELENTDLTMAFERQ